MILPDTQHTKNRTQADLAVRLHQTLVEYLGPKLGYYLFVPGYAVVLRDWTASVSTPRAIPKMIRVILKPEASTA